MTIFLALGVHDTVARLNGEDEFIHSIENDSRVDVEAEDREIFPTVAPAPHAQLKNSL